MSFDCYLDAYEPLWQRHVTVHDGNTRNDGGGVRLTRDVFWKFSTVRRPPYIPDHATVNYHTRRGPYSAPFLSSFTRVHRTTRFGYDCCSQPSLRPIQNVRWPLDVVISLSRRNCSVRLSQDGMSCERTPVSGETELLSDRTDPYSFSQSNVVTHDLVDPSLWHLTRSTCPISSNRVRTKS